MGTSYRPNKEIVCLIRETSVETVNLKLLRLISKSTKQLSIMQKDAFTIQHYLIGDK